MRTSPTWSCARCSSSSSRRRFGASTPAWSSHPGPHGDRGPSSLDWAIELGFDEWGVTVLEAVEEADAGDIWETRKFKMRPVGKSSIYRHEVRRAAVEMLVFAVHNFARGDFEPTALNYDDPNVTGRLRPLIKQADRAIDWRCDSTAAVVRKIRAAEGHPGVLDTIAGHEFFLFNVHVERGLRGRPGEHHRHAQRRDLSRHRRRRGVDHPSQGEGRSGLVQAPGDPRTRARRHRARRARDPGRAARADSGRPRPTARSPTRRRRGVGYLQLRLLQRRDEHRPVPSTARGLPVRAQPPDDQGDRAAGRRATSSPTAST